MELVKQDIRNVKNQRQLQRQYNHEVIHSSPFYFLAAPAAPGYIRILTGNVKTPGKIKWRKSNLNLSPLCAGTPGAPGASSSHPETCPQKMAENRSLEFVT